MANDQVDACGIKGFVPDPPPWSRAGGNNCPNCVSNYGYAGCIGSNGLFYSTYALDQRRKAEILKYKGNSAQLSRAQQYSMASRNAFTRKKSWATQTQTYTNPNVNNLPEIQNAGGVAVALQCNQPNVLCSLTSDSDVPGPVIPLCIDESVPLYNYKLQVTPASGGTGNFNVSNLILPPAPAPTPTPTPPVANALTVSTEFNGNYSVSTDGAYTIYTFNPTTSPSGTVTPNNTFNVAYLIVGGGGSGGRGDGGLLTGGGGGAGGVIQGTQSIINLTSYNVSVGAGGVISNGGSSQFDTNIAIGGGFGGDVGIFPNSADGGNGGSGGGATSNNGGFFSIPRTGGTAVSGQGFPGGNNTTNTTLYSAGGGGASQPGGNADAFNNKGGDGLQSAITGVLVYYGGGGGGTNVSQPPNGGLGGGGSGVIPFGNGANGVGGGGGGSNNSSGTSGGSGVVILRFLTNNP